MLYGVCMSENIQWEVRVYLCNSGMRGCGKKNVCVIVANLQG
jgi:hypothetical protein